MHYAEPIKTVWLVVRIPPVAWASLAVAAGASAAIAIVLLIRG